MEVDEPDPLELALTELGQPAFKFGMSPSMLKQEPAQNTSKERDSFGILM